MTDLDLAAGLSETKRRYNAAYWTRQAIIDALETRPMTTVDLCTALGVERCTVGKSVRSLRKAKIVRITGWFDHPGVKGRRSPVYALGSSPDVPEPCKRNKNTRTRISGSASVQQTDGTAEREIAARKAKASNAVAKATSRQHSWASALGL